MAIGLIAAGYVDAAKPFGPNLPGFVYYAIIGGLTLFGAWEGGLTGIASENKKIALFHGDLDAGNYLLLIYAKKAYEDQIQKIMGARHPEAELAAVDVNFYNPLTELKRL